MHPSKTKPVIHEINSTYFLNDFNFQKFILKIFKKGLIKNSSLGTIN